MVQIGSDCQPMKSKKSFFTKLRSKLFDWLVEAEIYGGIFCHINQEHDEEYPHRGEGCGEPLDVGVFVEKDSSFLQKTPPY